MLAQIAILQVGGVEPPETAIPRSEYIIAGFAAGGLARNTWKRTNSIDL